MKNVFLSLLLCLLASLLFHCVYAEDPGFRSKVVHREIVVDDAAIKTLGIKTETVVEKDIDEVVKTTGQIEGIPKNQFDINSSVQGVVKSVIVDLGDVVSTGQSLLVIKSTEIAKLQAEVDQFKAELELARINFEREKSLFDQGISPKKDFDASRAILASAEAKLNAAESNLKILADLTATSEPGEFTVKTQKTGTIIERNITIGQVVNSNQILFRGIDLSTVWANADIYERDLAKVKLGQKVNVALDGSPGRIFEGNLTYIGSVINKDARTLPVKAILENKDGLLKPGAFIQLLIGTGQKKKSIVIPRVALVETDKEDTEGSHEHIVYVQDMGSFKPRKIQVEPHDSSTALVLSGLMDGEVIVTEGSYQLQYGHTDTESQHGNPMNKIPVPVFILIASGLVISFFIFKKKSKSL
ncbi:MAG: efflux RND transporter periplasmic adaptor subunit [Candidatus Melainabacteria bacterium]|nr:efflux RND transporter periplasmic adaptor subunit [Candidatus Melainabacteria bacterium]